MFVAAGCEYKAIAEVFTATANTNGQMSIAFNDVSDEAQANAIEVLSGGTTLLAEAEGDVDS